MVRVLCVMVCGIGCVTVGEADADAGIIDICVEVNGVTLVVGCTTVREGTCIYIDPCTGDRYEAGTGDYCERGVLYSSECE